MCILAHGVLKIIPGGRHRQVGTDRQTLGPVRKSTRGRRIVGNTTNRRLGAPARGLAPPSRPPPDRPEPNRSNPELARRTLSSLPLSPTPLKREYNAVSVNRSMKFGNIVRVETSRYLTKIATLRKVDRKQRAFATIVFR
jgi:hypothetical protein